MRARALKAGLLSLWVLAGASSWVVLDVGSARAGGLYLSEFGTPSMGVASAGAGARASDASTALHNPAGMTRLDDHQAMGSIGMLTGDIQFDTNRDTPVAGNDGGQQGGPAPVLGAFYSHRLSDRFRAGVSLVSVSGSVLDPNADWAGRYQIQKIEFFTITMAPSLAYRVTDWLSVGAGANVTYGRMTYKAAFPPPNGRGRVKFDKLDDWEPGFNLSALLTLAPGTRMSVLYQSETELDLGGDVKISTLPVNLKASLNTKLPLVQFVRVGLYHDLTRRWTLLAQAGWEDWSSLEKQFVSVGGVGSGSIPRRWTDTWQAGAGVIYQANPEWIVQAGFRYDSRPVNQNDRTADLPIDEQWRFAFGAQRQLNERVNIGGAFEYAFYGDAKIRSSQPGGLVGSYSRNNLFFFALNLNWSGLWGSGG